MSFLGEREQELENKIEEQGLGRLEVLNRGLPFFQHSVVGQFENECS
jgi:hypothetical protein